MTESPEDVVAANVNASEIKSLVRDLEEVIARL
jgi:hypothetical protein